MLSQPSHCHKTHASRHARSMRSLVNKNSSPRSPPLLRCKTMPNNLTMTTAGGRILCVQCQATAKSTRQQCRRPATSGKRVCKLHGGKSTGPRTLESRQRCAEVRTVHGRETTTMRKERSLASARLAVLESVGFTLGLMTGKRTPGRRPDRMAEAYPELQSLALKLLREKL